MGFNSAFKGLINKYINVQTKYNITDIRVKRKLDPASGQADLLSRSAMKKICLLIFKMLTHKISNRERQKQMQRSRALFRTVGPR